MQAHLKGIRGRRARTLRPSERGEGKLKPIIFIAAAIFAIFSAIKVIPAYVKNYELSDKMQEQARFSVVNHYTEDQVRDNIYKVVEELELPAKRESITVSANNSVVRISMEYTVPVDLFIYRTELHFSPSSENKALFD